MLGFHFQALQLHYVRHMAVFFVDDIFIARNLASASKKIRDTNYHKVIINVEHFNIPEEQMVRSTGISNTERSLDQRAKHIQSCLQKRYKESFRSLDLSNITSDPGLISSNVFYSVNVSSDIEILLQIISKSYPELQSLNLKCNQISRLFGFMNLFHLAPQLHSLDLSYNKLSSLEELNHIHNLQLRELRLKGNPFLVDVESQSAYYRLMIHHFPTIKKLDGLILKENSFFFELEKPKPLLPTKGSFFVNDEVKGFLARFLHRYFTLYDSDDREALLTLYHENACCSFSLPDVHYERNRFKQIKEYWKQNHNLLRVKKPGERHALIKYTKQQVVRFLCSLPKTEHDLPSMNLDVAALMPSMICFTVEGKFKEVNMSCCHNTPFFPFKRTFIVIPFSEDSAQIVNDQMVILNSCATPQGSPSPVYPAPSPVYPAPSPVYPAPSPVSAMLSRVIDAAPRPPTSDIVQSFAQYSGMKHDWASKCLQDNNWDLQQAQVTFNHLKIQDAIPPEAFEAQQAAGDMSG
ncbi:hypothetical protein PRIEUP_LOCUS10374 [Pristimantis euphronides]